MVKAATIRQAVARMMPAPRNAAGPKPNQLNGLYGLLKAQRVEAVARDSGQRDDELAVDHTGAICHSSPPDRRRETAGLFQHKAGCRIRPGNGCLVIGGRDDREGRHRADGQARGEFGSIVGAVSRGGGDGIAYRDGSWEGSNETRIAIIAGHNAYLPEVNLPFAVPVGVAY